MSSQGRMLRCRTCDRAVERLEMRHDRLVGTCESCADRTPLRCPSCGDSLKSSDRRAICNRGHEWRVEGTSLVSPYGRKTARPSEGKYTFQRRKRKRTPGERPRRSVPPPERVAEANPESLRVQEKQERVMRGYRDASLAHVLELVRPARWRRKNKQPRWMIALALTLSLASAIGAFTVASEIVGRVALGLLSVGMLLALLFDRLYTRDAVGVEKGAVRIGPEEIESSEEDDWKTIARTEDALAIVSEPDGKGRYRIRVDLENAEPLVLLEELEEAEATEAAARATAHIERYRSS